MGHKLWVHKLFSKMILTQLDVGSVVIAMSERQREREMSCKTEE